MRTNSRYLRKRSGGDRTAYIKMQVIKLVYVTPRVTSVISPVIVSLLSLAHFEARSKLLKNRYKAQDLCNKRKHVLLAYIKQALKSMD